MNNLVAHPEGRPWRVLVVDDQAQILSAVQRVLTFEAVDVVAAETGSQALELLAKTVFDLVLLDINMPDMDGFSVLAKLRKIDRMADLPVIMVTGMVDPEIVLRGKAYGVSEYLIKPYKISELLIRVDRCLTRLAGAAPG